ncbi:HlyD family secretion protein [Mucilaginibacter sp.]|jgi:HlyD family secretion protein|uniref:HlyD family secretion protein n=1 Tax=Mucilaginibacter sp. TaxID=1882438 RepID=UPI0035631860
MKYLRYRSGKKLIIQRAAWCGLNAILILSACGKKEDKPDAYGNFESVETVVSAQADGSLLRFRIQEGQALKAGEDVGMVDTLQTSLKKLQLESNKQGLDQKLPSIKPELDVLRQQITTQLHERDRTKNLLAVGAATGKQLDDINAQIKLLQQQLQARSAELKTQTRSTLSDKAPINAQISQLKDQISKSNVINPVPGTVLVKYAEQGEIVRYGTPLYKVAAIDTIILRAYVAGGDLSRTKIGQEVKVRIDKDKDDYQYFKGRITWISTQAEFTPKIIQTKDERVNMVYAVKVLVANNGNIKIGMPGEVFLNANAVTN